MIIRIISMWVNIGIEKFDKNVSNRGTKER